MDEALEKFKRLSTGIQEVIECPICFNTMDSKLKLCLNGHGVCSSCASKVDKCPSCRREFVFHQNTLLGQILECLPKQCGNSDKGCDTMVFDKEHEMFCGFRASKCLKTFCEWEGCAKDLLHHVKTCEFGSPVCEFDDLNVKKSRSYTFSMTENKHFFSPIVFQDQLFWKYFHRNGLTKCISHEFYYVPTTKPSKIYYLIISFKRGKIEYKHTCKSSTKREKNRKNHPVENGLIIPDSELDKFREPGSDNSYVFTAELVCEDIA